MMSGVPVADGFASGHRSTPGGHNPIPITVGDAGGVEGRELASSRPEPNRRDLGILATVLRDGYYAAASDFGISPQTVKNRCHMLYQKLGVASKDEAAFVLGWLRIPEGL